MAHHDDESPATAQHNPANRIGLDYRALPARRLPQVRLIDVHTHVRMCPTTDLFFQAAGAYGVERIVSMSPLDDVDALRAAYPGRLDFIAIPRWREFAATDAFRQQWLRDLSAFREKGARVMKFWVAPPLRGQHGLTLEHEFVQPVIREALDLDYNFMIHAGDPSVWWQPGARYADVAKFGTKRDQYRQLEFLLQTVAPRFVIGAHMGGNVEDPDFLQDLLDRYPNYYLDSSATKWIVREVARQPQRVREFVLRNQDRILFGTDLVIADANDFDHYASRYWAHQMMWETPYRGESPIDDPDAEQPPQLAGLDLPADVLKKLYRENALRPGVAPSHAAAR
jgi:predicted TIM-barrel fold metal-dependent hydrolase